MYDVNNNKYCVQIVQHHSSLLALHHMMRCLSFSFVNNAAVGSKSVCHGERPQTSCFARTQAGSNRPHAEEILLRGCFAHRTTSKHNSSTAAAAVPPPAAHPMHVEKMVNSSQQESTRATKTAPPQATTACTLSETLYTYD